ncbi:PH domain-containing protein [Holzapfeliella sp. He02]|uniref:PH domain-containing protein n=1 Tax=Holzapfeliella saturejae TaxID=3082953 RepID=A0ABU8SGB2_9LACO
MDYQLLTQKMPSRIKRAWLVSDILGVIISLAIATTALTLLPIPHKEWVRPIALVAIVVFFAVSLSLIPYRYHFHRYQIDDEAISFQRGVFFRKTVYVPLNRVQHIEIEQGPILKVFDLEELIIHTAATKHSISGLNPATAGKLREEVTKRVKVADLNV